MSIWKGLQNVGQRTYWNRRNRRLMETYLVCVTIFPSVYTQSMISGATSFLLPLLSEWTGITFSSLQFSHSVTSDSLQPHGLQQARPPHPTPTPGVYSCSCWLSQWCHPTISSSVVRFSSHLQSFPPSGSFQISQFFPSGGQSTLGSASASILPMNIQDWFPLGWIGWNSLQAKGLLRAFSNTTVQKHQFFGT